jgi:hypothetical protein
MKIYSVNAMIAQMEPVHDKKNLKKKGKKLKHRPLVDIWKPKHLRRISGREPMEVV